VAGVGDAGYFLRRAKRTDAESYGHDAISQAPRGVLGFFASVLAPTGIAANALIAILPGPL
jgi:hypothetical protein